MATGNEGPIVLNNTHQLYLKAKLNYGTSGNIKAVVRGWNGGSIVAYFDPSLGEWGVSSPSTNYPVSTTGYTTVKYLFPTSSFPAATPDSFDVIVYNDVSGSFLTIDDIHLDVLMKKNAFLDYIVPTGYMIQMTPDIGWHDIRSMFESQEDLNNPHLKT